MKLNLTSKKLVLGLAGLMVILAQSILDSMFGLPHADLVVKAAVTLGLGGVATQGTIDLLKEFLASVGGAAK
jgi:hypothetical protein